MTFRFFNFACCFSKKLHNQKVNSSLEACADPMFFSSQKRKFDKVEKCCIVNSSAVTRQTTWTATSKTTTPKNFSSYFVDWGIRTVLRQTTMTTKQPRRQDFLTSLDSSYKTRRWGKKSRLWDGNLNNWAKNSRYTGRRKITKRMKFLQWR